LTDEQKSGAARIAIVVLGVAVAVLVVFACGAFLGWLNTDYFVGRTFFSILFNSHDWQSLIGPLGVIVTAGLALGAALPNSGKFIRRMLVVFGLGLGAALLLWIAVNDRNIGSHIARHAGRLIDHSELIAATGPLLTWVTGSLAAGLVALLGISTLKKKEP
jgi:hypothetical protein